MRASVSMARDSFTLLRRRIAEIEGLPDAAVEHEQQASPFPVDPSFRRRPESSSGGASSKIAFGLDPGLRRGDENVSISPHQNGATLPFALPRLDRMLLGGLRRDALHEIRSATTRDAAAATGFAVALLARLAASDHRPLLWIVEADAAREAGDPYGVGLAGFGLDPSRLVVARVKRPTDALWVFEEGLACRGLAGVLAEIRGNPRLLDLTASRRLALRAAAGGGTGLLLRQAGEPEPGAALTRWLIAPLPAGTTGDYAAGVGCPAWRLTLERNRKGRTGTIDVEWNHERRAFALAAAGPALPAHSLPLPPLPPNRPPSPPDAGKIVALPVPARQEFLLPREIKRRHARSRG